MTATALCTRVIQPHEDELAARCRSGDLDAFERLYALYGDSVFRYAYYLTGNRDDAADVKQETFLRAYQSLGAFRADSSLLTWLLKICVNLCRDRLRSWEHRQVIYREAAEELLPAGGQEDDPQQALERAHTVQTILRALNGLSSAQREVIILHAIENLEYPEIGRILGCSAATAKMRVFRARRSLKERALALLKGDES